MQQNNILLEQNALIYEISIKNSEISRIYSAMELWVINKDLYDGIYTPGKDALSCIMRIDKYNVKRLINTTVLNYNYKCISQILKVKIFKPIIIYTRSKSTIKRKN